jgi:hypothetical protein
MGALRTREFVVGIVIQITGSLLVLRGARFTERA